MDQAAVSLITEDLFMTEDVNSIAAKAETDAERVGYPSYSMLLSVYAGANVAHFDMAMQSVMEQTVPPAEVVIVEDGPIPYNLESSIKSWKERCPCPVLVVSYESNRGLAYALMVGVEACSCEFVARMDADDWSHPERMRLELKAINEDPKLDMVGSQIYEFIQSVDMPTSYTNLPLEHGEIVRFSKRRNPFRHPTMLMRRAAIIDCGNYRPDFLYFEDWDLFNRMLANGCKARNLPSALVAMRADSDFFERRGGLSYLRYMWRFKSDQLKRGYFTLPQFLMTFIPHAVVCLIPNGARAFVYNMFLRKNNNLNS